MESKHINCENYSNHQQLQNSFLVILKDKYNWYSVFTEVKVPQLQGQFPFM